MNGKRQRIFRRYRYIWINKYNFGYNLTSTHSIWKAPLSELFTFILQLSFVQNPPKIFQITFNIPIHSKQINLNLLTRYILAFEGVWSCLFVCFHFLGVSSERPNSGHQRHPMRHLFKIIFLPGSYHSEWPTRHFWKA